MPGVALRGRSSFGAGAATIRVGDGRQAFLLDGLTTGGARGVTALLEAAQRRFELAELRLRGLGDRAENIVVLPLGHLFRKVSAQRIRLVPQVRARPARPVAQLFPALEQMRPYSLDIHLSLPKLTWSPNSGPEQPAAKHIIDTAREVNSVPTIEPQRLRCSSSHRCMRSNGSTNFATPSRSSCSATASRSTPRRSSPSRASLAWAMRSEEHTSELQSRSDLVCRLLLEKKKN